MKQKLYFDGNQNIFANICNTIIQHKTNLPTVDNDSLIQSNI